MLTLERSVLRPTCCPIIWEAIQRLELNGLSVISVTADGASPNRKFFRMYKNPKDKDIFIHKARNLYSIENRWVYFFSDPPHLIKTICNCWSHSVFGGTRLMKVNTVLQVVTILLFFRIQVSGKYIEWKHLQSSP